MVLCKRPHQAYLFSRFLIIVPLPGLFGLMSLLLSIHFFFLLVIKKVFSKCREFLSVHEWKMCGPVGTLLFKDIRRLLHGIKDGWIDR